MKLFTPSDVQEHGAGVLDEPLLSRIPIQSQLSFTSACHISVHKVEVKLKAIDS
jgi:hypothetical protein